MLHILCIYIFTFIHHMMDGREIYFVSDSMNCRTKTSHIIVSKGAVFQKTTLVFLVEHFPDKHELIFQVSRADDQTCLNLKNLFGRPDV